MLSGLWHELGDWLALGENSGQVRGNASTQAESADVEKGVHDRGNQALDADRIIRWLSGVRSGTANDLAHPQTTAVEQ